MKRIFTLLLSTSLFPLLSMAQNVGVDVAVPVQKLDVAGGIKIGNTATGAAGSLRWDGTNIQYHDGTSWIDLVANSDNQTLSIALNQLAITGGNSVDLTPYLDNTDQQNLGLTGTSLSITGGTGVDLSPLQGQLIDDDSDTKVQVEESPDEDIIRFDIGGNERWVMRGSRLENAGTGNSVFVGQNAGQNDDLATRMNTALGANALSSNVSGIWSVAIGYNALPNSTNMQNTAIGALALESLTTGDRNIAIGVGAGRLLENGQYNVFLGNASGRTIESGSSNTIIGWRAGYTAGAASSGNVFLGREAGFSETGNNKLYIDNSSTASPLIYGDFAANTLQVNGALNVNGAYTLPTTDGAAAGYVMSTDAAGNVTWTNPGLTGDITGVIAGAGLINGGTSGDVTIDANPDNLTIEVAADELRVKPDGITANEIGANQVGTSELAPNAVTTVEIAPNTITVADIGTDAVAADEIATGAVTTDEILNATILPEDIDPAAGSANNVLSIVGGVAAWVDPATVNTTLQDTDTDTRIEVEQSADEDYIRMYTSNGTNSKETITIEPADAGTDAFAVGQVGIGTNTPDRDLHIAAPAGSQLLLSRGDITTSNGDILGELMFDSEDDSGPSTNNASAMIRGTATENHGDSNKGGMLSFFTKQNAGGGSPLAATERMRITQDGNVGIGGATNPTQKLDVAGAIRSTGQHYINNDAPTIYFQDNNHETGMIHMNSNLMYFLSGTGVNSTTWATNGSQWPLVINMTNDDMTFGGRALFMEGNVGVGTNNPGNSLVVGTNSPVIRVGRDSYNQAESGRLIFEENIAANTGTITCGFGFRHDGNANNLYLEAGCTGLINLMTFERGGEIGIRTTTPDHTLDVVGNVEISTLAGSGNRVVQADASGTLIVSNDLPANDASYIWNGTASQGANFHITGQGDIGTELYIGNWVRHSDNDGTVWNSGWHIYPRNGDDMNIRSGNTGSGSMALMNGTSTRGFIHWTADNQGWLNSARQWQLRTRNDDGLSPNLYFDEEGNESWTGDPGADEGKIEYHSNRFYMAAGSNSSEITRFRRSGGDVGSVQNDGGANFPIFRDYNDNGYYLDPNSTSREAGRIRGGTLHGPNPTWGDYLSVGANGREWIDNGDVASVATTNGNLHLDAASGRDMYLNYYDGNNIYFGRGNNSNRALLNGNGLYLYDGWLRPHGANGLYFESYGGGWHMTDATWIRAYNSKSVYTPNIIRGDAGVHANDQVRMRASSANQYGSINNFGATGVTIESGLSESGGFHADGDQADIWSPGDGGRLLRIWDEDGMNERAYIDGGGRVYSNQGFSTFSDMRLKKNITTINSALDKVMTMRGVNYDMREEILMRGEIEEGKDFDAEALKNQSGFIAQELLEVYPEVVTYDEEKGYYAVQYDGVIPVLVEAMKEQQAIIEALQKRLDALENK